VDDYIGLTAAAKRSPGRPNTATVWRWARKGVRSRTGERTTLEHIRAGGKLFTRPEWLDQFFKAVADADAKHFNGESIAVVKPATTRQREKQIEHAEKTLERAGIL